jgi:hypothetical protein
MSAEIRPWTAALKIDETRRKIPSICSRTGSFLSDEKAREFSFEFQNGRDNAPSHSEHLSSSRIASVN